MGPIGGAGGSLSREAASSLGRRNGTPQRPAEAIDPRSVLAKRNGRFEGDDLRRPACHIDMDEIDAIRP